MSASAVPYVFVAATGEVINYGQMSPDQLTQTPGAVQILPAQYTTLLAGGRFFYNNGTLTAISPTPPLAQAQAAASASVDAAAEACRQLFMTSGSGQALVYQAKALEANSFLAKYPTQDEVTAASPAIVNTDWPFLSAEVGITGPDLFSVAMVISGIQGEWTSIAAQIEHLRLGAKLAISNATDIPTINAALAISWPTLAAP